MTHVFMYPRVAQIAPRAHSVSAFQLAKGPRPDARGLSSGATAPSATAGRASALPSTIGSS
jgi:hypothetical protein